MKRMVLFATRFNADFKKLVRQFPPSKNKDLYDTFDAIVERLSMDIPLDRQYRDHPLRGSLRGLTGLRDCHIRGDLVLLYRKTTEGQLQILALLRIGSHSELGL